MAQGGAVFSIVIEVGMGLKVSVHHPLGERSLLLVMRSDGRPLMVGRAPHVDVSIPSTAVGRNHCALYVREGAWMIADSGSGRGTWVNGMEVIEPIPLKVGDLIVLGRGGDVKPPTIRILEHTPPASAAEKIEEGAMTSGEEAGAPLDSPEGVEGYADTIPPAPVADEAETATEDFVDLGLRAPSRATPHARHVKQRRAVAKTRMGPVGWAFGIILALALVAASIWGIQKLKHQLQTQGGVKMIFVNEPATKPAEKPKENIFTPP
jgi:hypothetical protein